MQIVSQFLVLLTAVNLAFFIILLLLRKARRTKANYFFVAFLVFYIISIFTGVSLRLIALELRPYGYIVNLFFMTLISPFGLSYFKISIHPDMGVKKFFTVNSIISIFIFITSLPVFYFCFYRSAIIGNTDDIASAYQDFEGAIKFCVALVTLHQGGGIIFIWKLISATHFKNNYSKRWICAFFRSLLTCWAAFFMSNVVLNHYFDWMLLMDIDILIFSIVVYFMTFQAITQPYAFWARKPLKARPVIFQVSPPSAPTVRYQKSGLDDVDIQRIVGRIETEFRVGKLWRDSNLTVQSLADHLSIRREYISQALNDGLGQSFSEYLNALRIQDAQSILLSSAGTEKTILEVALFVGYNSKSAFNAAFKRLTGCAPTQWLQAHRVHETHAFE
jgi:AraC-like DNA-binding protein